MNVIVQDDITLVVKKDTPINSISPTIDIFNELVAPISENTIIGTISYNVYGNTYTSNLLAGNDVAESNLMNTILTIISIILVIFLLYRLVKFNRKKRA